MTRPTDEALEASREVFWDSMSEHYFYELRCLWCGWYQHYESLDEQPRYVLVRNACPKCKSHILRRWLFGPLGDDLVVEELSDD